MTITINGSGTITGASTLATAVASPTLTTPNIDSAQIPTVSGTAPLYMCRAWVNFNGKGTVAIRGNGNVSSITDNGTGDYTVNFTTAMPDVNYSVFGSSGSDNTYGSYVFNNPGAGSRFAVGSCRINSFISQTAGLSDVDTVCVSFFR